MSGDLLTDLDLAPERETVREPAKAWENRFLALAAFDCGGDSGEPGELLVFGDYPSRDVAETAAHEWMSKGELDGFGVVGDWVEYLGAFPVDENGEPL